MTISEDNLELQLRTNNGLQANIWEALWKEATLRSLDLGSLSIKANRGDVYLSGYLKEESLPLIESVIYSVVGVVEVHNHLRTNDGILYDIWDALWKVDTYRSLDLGGLSIKVKGGEVYLDGYLAQSGNLRQIERIVHSIDGVVAVHSNLIVDRDLIIRVAQALAGDERTNSFILQVDAFHGWIHVVGEVPTCDLQQVVEKIAAGVYGVRGVTLLPMIAGESSTILRRPVQPRIGATVYGKEGEVGVVTQVVIRPDNRLVTHIVTRTKELSGGNLVSREIVIPLEASDLVKNESVFIQRHGPSQNVYPVLNPDKYPLAESTWKAPYPYTAGEVRWSLREILEVASRPTFQPETEAQVEDEGSPKLVMAQTGLRSE
jgi:osmotically-inducible protein OsmY